MVWVKTIKDERVKIKSKLNVRFDKKLTKIIGV